MEGAAHDGTDDDAGGGGKDAPALRPPALSRVAEAELFGGGCASGSSEFGQEATNSGLRRRLIKKE
jgi:hypothetical protein